MVQVINLWLISYLGQALKCFNGYVGEKRKSHGTKIKIDGHVEFATIMKIENLIKFFPCDVIDISHTFINLHRCVKIPNDLNIGH